MANSTYPDGHNILCPLVKEANEYLRPTMLQRHARKRDSKQQTREEFAQINTSQMQYAVLPSGQRWLQKQILRIATAKCWHKAGVAVLNSDRTARVVWAAISRYGGTAFQTTMPDSVAYACLCLQADGGERNGKETQKLWAGAGCLQRHVMRVEKTKR